MHAEASQGGEETSAEVASSDMSAKEDKTRREWVVACENDSRITRWFSADFIRGFALLSCGQCDGGGSEAGSMCTVFHCFKRYRERQPESSTKSASTAALPLGVSKKKKSVERSDRRLSTHLGVVFLHLLLFLTL